MVFQVNGVSFMKYHVNIGNGTQEAQKAKNLGVHSVPLSADAIIQPNKNINPAGTPKTNTARYSLPFHHSNTI